MKKTFAVAVVLAILFPLGAKTAAASATPAAQTIYSLLGTSTPVESSAPIEKEITSLSKQAGSFTAPVLAYIDLGRNWIAAVLQKQIIWTAPKLPGNALIAPAQAQMFTTPNQFDWNKLLTTIVGILWTVYFYVLVIIRFLIAKALLCYPILLVAVVYILYRVIRHFRRPRWGRR